MIRRGSSPVCGAKGGDMDHQTLLWAHYSLQKATTLPRSQADIKKDDADFTLFSLSLRVFSFHPIASVRVLDWFENSEQHPLHPLNMDVILSLCYYARNGNTTDEVNKHSCYYWRRRYSTLQVFLRKDGGKNSETNDVTSQSNLILSDAKY